LLPISAFAAVDLGVQTSDITFSTNSFVVGQKAKVYVKVRSYGDQDASGLVNLYLNNQLLDAGLAVSVVSSEPDTVYSEFTIPDKNFKISVDLKNVYPSETRLQNNNAITAEQVVDIDTDGDGTGDNTDTDDDNDGLSDIDEGRIGTNPKKVDTDGDGYGDAHDAFPLDRNEWLDTDGDGTGDNADTDDDNDGLTDSQEASIKTNPKKADSDGDGYNDKDDAYPLDPTRHVLAVVAVPTPPKATTNTPPATPTPEPTKSTPPAAPDQVTSTPDASEQPAENVATKGEDPLDSIKEDLDKIKKGEPLQQTSDTIFHVNKPGFWIMLIGLLLVMFILLKLRSRGEAKPQRANTIGKDDFELPPSVQRRRVAEISEPEVPTKEPIRKTVSVKVKKVSTRK
jgi:hypothetical protein